METWRPDADPEGAQGDSANADQLARSAQGWHRLQLAVLGFIGLCGVLQRDGGSRPEWLEDVAGWLSISALAIACVATYLVGRVAWPFVGVSSGEKPDGRARTLRLGVALTYAATAVMALAALSNWWPGTSTDAEGAAGAGLVRVTAAEGRSLCGRLVEAPAGSLRMQTDRGPVDLVGSNITAIVSVDRC